MSTRGESSIGIGIDLGTTHCCVGVFDAETSVVDIIENQHGERTTPSYVAFSEDKEVIGKNAKEKVSRNPANVIYDSKRFIGRLFNDEYLQYNLSSWFFNVVKGEDNSPLVQVVKNDTPVTYKPHKISAKLLAYMKKIAEQKIGKKVNDAVITVPAYFNYNQRIATRKAAKLAKLHVLKIMNEPTASALAYVHKNQISQCNNVLVFDLGGGTFDVTVVSINNKDITVKATSGNTFLGGRDFDNNIVNFIVKKLEEVYKKDITTIPASMRRLNARAEKIKIILSFEESTSLDLHNILNDGQEVDLEITRADFEKINLHLFELCLTTVGNCLKQAGVTKEEIEKILLIGGSTRIPCLRNLIAEYFGGSEKITQGINPDEAVAYGAAIEAATFTKGKCPTKHVINEVIPLSIGIDVMGNLMSFIIKRNTPIPVSVTKPYITVSDEQKEMALNVYEGERSLVKYNTKIGTCIVKLPLRPPGYPVQVTFSIDTNGNLDVGCHTETGLYSNLCIDYENHVAQKVSDMLEDSIKNRENDNRENQVVLKWIRLKEYCINIKSLLTYKWYHFSDTDKLWLDKKIEETAMWVCEHKVQDGSEKEENDLDEKLREFEYMCGPILKKSGYNISEMCISELYKLYKSQKKTETS